VGEVCIPRSEFLYELRLWEINAIIRGYRRRAHTLWEATRWQTFCIVQALGAGKDFSRPSDLMAFPWEDEQSELPTEEEIDEMTELLNNINSHEKD
jgi:hypothetical protein